MRKSLIIAITFLAIFLMFDSSILAQSGKLVYIDSYRIRTEYKEFQEAQSNFDKELDDWQQEAMDMEQALDSLKRDLEEKALLLSAEARQKKEDLISTKEAALQKYMVEVFGQGGKAEVRNQELTKPLLDKITAVLEKIAQENNYDYIFDSVNGNIAYAKKSLDITEKVLEELQKTE